MTALAIYATVAIAGLGTALVGLGMFIVVKAMQARAEITATLLEENATTPTSGARRAPEGGTEDADSEKPVGVVFETDVPAQPIRDARTARVRIDEITTRTVRAVGPWQSLPEDPKIRQWFLNGLTIRTALSVAVMGYGVANIALALGAALVLIGAAALGVGIPLVVQSSI